MQLFPDQLAIANLRNELRQSERGFMTKDEAFQMLREDAEVDFGEDIDKWKEWVKRKYADLPKPEEC